MSAVQIYTSSQVGILDKSYLLATEENLLHRLKLCVSFPFSRLYECFCQQEIIHLMCLAAMYTITRRHPSVENQIRLSKIRQGTKKSFKHISQLNKNMTKGSVMPMQCLTSTCLTTILFVLIGVNADSIPA